MKKSKTQKGITLIALIITIVILLILAVVTINAIQGDGIIRYASNAADEYTKKADEEQKTIDALLGQIEGNVGEKTTSGLTIGDEVDINGEDFYVIGFKDNNETVILLTKHNIDTKKFVQSSSADYVTFCDSSADNYWDGEYGNIEEEEPIPSTHTAAYAAYKYGETLGVTTGRLMTLEEAETLKNDVLVGENRLSYWLGTSNGENEVFIFYYDGDNNCYVSTWKSYETGAGVRPVVEVSKANIK